MSAKLLVILILRGKSGRALGIRRVLCIWSRCIIVWSLAGGLQGIRGIGGPVALTAADVVDGGIPHPDAGLQGAGAVGGGGALPLGAAGERAGTVAGAVVVRLPVPAGGRFV